MADTKMTWQISKSMPFKMSSVLIEAIVIVHQTTLASSGQT
jgi:hypothetical protein